MSAVAARPRRSSIVAQVAGAATFVGSDHREDVADLDGEARRVENQSALAEDPNRKDSRVVAGMMNHDTRFGVEDEIVPNARQLEIADQFRARVDARDDGETTSTTITGSSISIVSSGIRGPQRTSASGS